MFPVLPVLDDLAERALERTRAALQATALVGAQHLLLSTGSLLETLFRLGLRSDRVCLLGKCYSQNMSVMDCLSNMGVSVLSGSDPVKPGRFAGIMEADAGRLWNWVRHRIDLAGVRTIVVLDDGGHCLETIPASICDRFRVVGIEQTTSGIRRSASNDVVPVISVAGSASKRHFEPPLISAAVLRRLQESIRPRTRIGVVGLGPIGCAVAKEVIAAGHSVFVNDRHEDRKSELRGARWYGSVADVLSAADMILGCTGEDIFAGLNREAVLSGASTLASCSSEDREFASLLRRAVVPAGKGSCRADLSVEFGRRMWRVLQCGFPINFDGSPESVPSDEIQLTRALLLAAVLQAVVMPRMSSNGHRVMLDPAVQAHVVRAWLAQRPERRRMYARALLEQVDDSDWFRRASDGCENRNSPLSVGLPCS